MIRRGVPDDDDPNQDPGDTSSPSENVVYMSAFDRAHPSTSINAFHEEEDSGRNQRRRDVVMRAFKKFGPGSSAEVLRAAGLGENLNLWRARVAELTNDGVLKKIEERRCQVTNHEVAILQYVEPKLRIRRVRVEPRDEMILQLCAALESLVLENPRLFVGQRDRLIAICDLIAGGRCLAFRHRVPSESDTNVEVDVPLPT